MIVKTVAEGQFLGVDWGAFVLVFVAALVATTAIVFFYALGLRLLSVGGADDAEHPSSRPLPATIGAYACFAVGVAAVLYGVYLIVPQLHGG